MIKEMIHWIKEWYKDEPKFKKPYKLTCQIKHYNSLFKDGAWGSPWIQHFTTRRKRDEMIKSLRKEYGRKNVSTRKEYV